MIEQYVAMDAAKAPEVLVFQIGAVAIFIHLDGYLVFTRLDIACDVEFRWFHRALAVACLLSVHPDVECRHYALEAQEGLTLLPTNGHRERTAILPRRVALLVGRPVLLRFARHIGRVNLERIAGRDVDRCAVAVYFPVGRHRQRLPA